MKKYTIDQFRKYLLSQDSKGDIMYNLSDENIDAANQENDFCECGNHLSNGVEIETEVCDDCR